MGYIAVFLIYAPIVWLAVMSFSERPLTGVPWPLTAEWYLKLYHDARWVEPIELSLLIAFVVALLCMLTATLVGRSLPAIRRRGGMLFTFLLPLFVPGIVLGVTIFMFYRSFLGIKTGVWSLVLVHFLWAFPFSLLGMLVVSVRFDHRLVEAAADLGANAWQRFWHIEFPRPQAWNHRRGVFRIPALVQRTRTQHSPAWRRDYAAPVLVVSDCIAHLQRAPGLRAEHNHYGRQPRPHGLWR